MVRPKRFDCSLVVSVRLEKSMHEMLHDIAALESVNTGKKVCVQDLIRDALTYVYTDNEKLRECFRRARAHLPRPFK